MGNTISQNVVDDVLNVVHTTVNKTMMTNSQAVSQVAGFHINAAGDVTVHDIKMHQDMKVMQTAALNAKTKATFHDDISQKMKQAAESVKQSLSLNPGSAIASNITSMMDNLTTDVSNSFSMMNKQQLDQQAVGFVKSGGNVKMSYITIVQANETVMNTIMSSSAVQETMLKLAQAVSQSAKAKEKGMLSGILMILIVILGGGVLLGKKLLEPKFLLPVGGVAGGAYYYTAIYRPKHPKTDPK